MNRSKNLGTRVLAALCLSSLTACAAISGTPVAQRSGPTAVLHTMRSVTNFGDSITCGVGATPLDGSGRVRSNEGYAGLMDLSLALPSNNQCRSGDQAADMARLWVYPLASPVADGGQLFTVMIGTNDANHCGGSAACMNVWSGALAASLAWLAMPSTDKITASAMTSTGAWAANPDFPTALTTVSAGSTLSFPVTQAVAGRSLNLAYQVFDASVLTGGVATVSIDGTVVGSMTTTPAFGVGTQNGVTDTIFLLRLPLGATGVHQVSVQTNTAGRFTLLWAGVPQSDYTASPLLPHVLVNRVPPSTSASLNAVFSTYNAVLDSLVQTLYADGMYITLAPTNNALTSSDLADLLHPNNSGHAKLAAVDEASLTQP